MAVSEPFKFLRQLEVASQSEMFPEISVVLVALVAVRKVEIFGDVQLKSNMFTSRNA